MGSVKRLFTPPLSKPQGILLGNTGVHDSLDGLG